MYLDRKAHDIETICRQHLKIVQLLQMRVADFPPSAVALPDQAGIAALLDSAHG